jgi:hypothetical protein
LITTSSSQVNANQDMPPVSESPIVIEQPVVQSSKAIKSASIKNSISTEEYADHMQLSLNQLATVTLMLQVLDQADGGPVPTE